MAQAKKVLLFVVEGPSEELAFGVLFSRLFDKHVVAFDIAHGDLTTIWAAKDGGKSDCGSNARNSLRDHVLQHVSHRDYAWKDLLRVVQIVDTDGAFIADELVSEVAEATGIRYAEDHMEFHDKGQACRRNRMKRQALAQLRNCETLVYCGKGVPYSVYYLSRNMEHALHGRTDDVDDEEKERLARRFQMQYKNDLDGFLHFLRSDNVATAGCYSETWDYIKEGCHSLERNSNLHLLLPEPNRE